jgi:hypothetical protein
MTTDELMALIVVSGLVLVLFIFLMRWIFRIDKLIKYQVGIIQTLFEIAKAQGVPKDKIEGIINTIKN